MSFSPAFLDELRWRVPLSETVGRKVRLVRTGREWKACCPFHNEKTPSFYVNDEKGFYHCFGCGAHGDVIRFVSETENLSFPEAVERLAGEAGLEVPRERPEDRARAERLTSARDVMERAAAWFAEQLDGLAGDQARAYLVQRGLTRETVRAFGLGWAPEGRTTLRSAFNALGVADDLLIECGLLIAVEDKPPYDRFRGRVMFPVRDPRGRVVAFGGRLLAKDEHAPKYLNSPETALFDKGRMLYNLDRAGPVARKSGEIIVVEGYMDVIALAQAGIAEAVAPLGTALTEDQIQLMWRIVPEPLLCFDGDSAGQRAASRAAVRALPVLKPGRSLRFMALPEGQDPDDLVKSGGASAFTDLKGTALPLIDLLWRDEQVAGDLSTPERRADLKARLRRHVATIGDPDVRALYGAEFRARLDGLFGTGQSRRADGGRTDARGPAGRRLPWGGQAPALPPSAELKRRDAAHLTQGGAEAAMVRSLLLLAVRAPEILHDDLELLAELPIVDDRLQQLRDQILESATRNAGALDSTRLRDTLAATGLEAVVGELDSGDSLLRSHKSTALGPDQRRQWFVSGVHRLVRLQAISAELAEIEADYRAALAADGAEAEADTLFQRKSWLQSEQRQMKSALSEALDSQKTY